MSHSFPSPWLQRLADRHSQPTSQDSCSWYCEESYVCRRELENGSTETSPKCKTYRKTFRKCTGQQDEIVEVSENDLAAPQPPGWPPAPTSTIYSQDMGQMFEEFFNYASELERNLLGTNGLDHQLPRTGVPVTSNPPEQASSTLSRLLWWPRQHHRENRPQQQQAYQDFTDMYQET